MAGRGGGTICSKAALRATGAALFVGAVIWMALVLGSSSSKDDSPLEFTVHDELRTEVSPRPSSKPSASGSRAAMVHQERPSPLPSVVVQGGAGQQAEAVVPASPSATPAPHFDLSQNKASNRELMQRLQSKAEEGQWRRMEVEEKLWESVESDTTILDVFASMEGFRALVQDVELECMHLRDVLAVDVDQDGEYDILTVNHNAEQTLLMHTDDGFEKEATLQHGIDIDPSLPGLAVHEEEPVMEESGLYIYWAGDRLYFHLFVHPGRIGQLSDVPDTIDLSIVVPLGPVAVFANDNRIIPNVIMQDTIAGDVVVTSLHMTLHHDSKFGLSWRRKAVAVEVLLEGTALPLSEIYVGHGLSHPSGYEFTVALRDRHSVVAIDANSDSHQDLLVMRGGLQGDIATLRYSDELLLFDPDTREYGDQALQTSLQERAARSNQAAVGDFDGDGVPELLVSSRDCRSPPDRPRVLQLAHDSSVVSSFDDVSSHFFGSLFGTFVTPTFTQFVVADMDRDGKDDIVSVGPFGAHFHTTVENSFVSTPCTDAHVFGSIDMCSVELSPALDVNGDGFPDVLLAGQTSMVVTYSAAAKAVVALPAEVFGLPADIQLARWVDYDNDGCVDVFTVPHGLFHARACEERSRQGVFGASFEKANLFEVVIPLPRGDIESSWVQWIDVDGDGSMDLAPIVIKSHTSANSCDLSTVALNYRSSGNWLQVDVQGPTGAPLGYGAHVTVIDSYGRHQTAAVSSYEQSRYSQTHLRLYFGLGQYRAADVFVSFPGDRHVHLTGVCTNCRILALHPAL